MDAKRKELVCITLGCFLYSASGNGILNTRKWDLEKKMGWEMGLVTPFQDPLFISCVPTCFYVTALISCVDFKARKVRKHCFIFVFFNLVMTGRTGFCSCLSSCFKLQLYADFVDNV